MSNKRIEKLALALEAAVNNPEKLQAIIAKAKICDLLVLQYLNMGYSGCGKGTIVLAIEDELNSHFSEGGEYLVHGSTAVHA